MRPQSTDPDMSKKTPAPATIRPIKKLMVANRSEIAIRVMCAATEPVSYTHLDVYKRQAP